MKEKAVVLLSGGIDSSTTLYYAISKRFKPYCLIFNYGQRHRREIESAKKIAKKTKSKFEVLKITLPTKDSLLLNKKKIPLGKIKRKSIPQTYVPARNIIFLSYALCFAESIKASKIFIGANAIDFSGYPDCRLSFYKAFQKVAKEGMKTGVEKEPIEIVTPLINLSKREIIELGIKLGVPYELTWSCYKGGKYPCRICDSCLLREKGFKELKMEDPLWKRLKQK
jgi:7-cyano-7-deazaguanine synthase